MANWSPDRQQAVQARCDKASDGPWRLDPDPRIDGADQVVDAENLTVCFMSTPIEDRESDASFIAHARTDLTDALAEIERLHGLIERMTHDYDSIATKLDEAEKANARSR